MGIYRYQDPKNGNRAILKADRKKPAAKRWSIRLFSPGRTVPDVEMRRTDYSTAKRLLSNLLDNAMQVK